MTSTKIGRLFSLAYTKPLSTAGLPLAGAQMFFYQTGAYTTQQTVYQDIALTSPAAQPLVADGNGRFAPVFLNPALSYSWQLYTAGSVLLEQADPVNTQNVAIPVTLYVPANESRSSTVTLANDLYLIYSIPAAGTYRIDIDLQWTTTTAGATPGLQYEIHFTGTTNAGAGGVFAVMGLANAATYAGAIQLNTLLSGQALATGAGQNVWRISGTIQATSAGTLTVQWAQNISSVTATTLGQGSSMTVTRVG